MTLEANLPISLETKWAWLSSRSHWTLDRKSTRTAEPGVKADGVKYQFFLATHKSWDDILKEKEKSQI